MTAVDPFTVGCGLWDSALRRPTPTCCQSSANTMLHPDSWSENCSNCSFASAVRTAISTQSDPGVTVRSGPTQRLARVLSTSSRECAEPQQERRPFLNSLDRSQWYLGKPPHAYNAPSSGMIAGRINANAFDHGGLDVNADAGVPAHRPAYGLSFDVNNPYFSSSA